MSFLVPTNSLLIRLSKEQLLRRRVCEKHFDKQQFDYQGKRLRLSYPCLLTDAEIAHGVPLSSPGTGENIHGHPSCSNSQPISLVREGQRDVVLEPPCFITKEIGVIADSEAMNPKPIQMEVLVQTQKNKKCPTQNRQDSLMKKLESRKKKFVKHVTKIATESLGQTAQQRLEKAAVYGNIEQLFKNFNFLTKQAQTFLMMQLKQCRKNKMARRFTLNEKLIALVIMKQSPKTYKLLENMFALPKKRH